MAKSSLSLTIVAVVLALAAAKISFNLLEKHLTGSSGEGWFEAGCAGEDSGGPSCDAVITSRHGYFPPKRDDEPEGTWHVPAAFLGLIYYSILTVWLVGVGRPSGSKRWVHLFPFGVLFFGLLSSIFYTYIMFADLDTWCPWCLVVHILNLLIAVCVVLMWPGKPEAVHAVHSGQSGASGSATTAGAPAVARSVHPSGRLLLTTVIAMGLVLFGESQLLGRKYKSITAVSAKQGFDQCMATVDRLMANTRKLVRNWQSGEKYEIHIRPDDPIRTQSEPGKPTWEVVVFSDLACPPCSKAGMFLEEKAQPLFAGHLKIVFKHYPLNSDCNRRTKSKMHKYACMGAAIAEAARILGGNDAFWHAHDLLFANQSLLNKGRLTPENVAIQLGFDPSLFQQTMESEAVAKRLWEDVNSTATLNIRGTPTVFVNGRKVDNLAVKDIDFWDMLADMYWRSVKTPRPDATKLRAIETTRGSQDQTGGP